MMDQNMPIAGKGDYYIPRGAGIWFLLGSLLLNCFLLGLLIAPVMHHHGPGPMGGPPPMDMAEHLTQGLAPADAKVVRDAFQQQEPVFKEGRTGMDNAMAGLNLVLVQPSVDPQSLQKALDDISAAHAKFDAAMKQLITQAVANLSVEGRQKFAASLKKPAGGGMHFHGDDAHRDGPPPADMPPSESEGPGGPSR